MIRCQQEKAFAKPSCMHVPLPCYAMYHFPERYTRLLFDSGSVQGARRRERYSAGVDGISLGAPGLCLARILRCQGWILVSEPAVSARMPDTCAVLSYSQGSEAIPPHITESTHCTKGFVEGPRSPGARSAVSPYGHDHQDQKAMESRAGPTDQRRPYHYRSSVYLAKMEPSLPSLDLL